MSQSEPPNATAAEDVTVLIANLGGLDDLRRCLRSIFDLTSAKTSMRVIVGFNYEGSDETPRALAAEFPQVEQLRASARLGYCRAYNQLMIRRTGRYVLLLDDDTMLRPDAIDGMVRFMDAQPRVGVAGCRTVNPDGSYQKTTAKMYSLATELVNVFQPAAFWNDGIDENITTWQSVGWLNAHFLIVRCAAIDEVGLFDEFYYTFHTEPDWCLRMRRAGWEVAYVPEFEVMHIGGAHSVVTAVKTPESLMRAHINRYYFIRKHYGAIAMHAFRFIMSAGALLRLLKYIVVWCVNPQRRPEARPKIGAYWRIVLRGAAVHPERLTDDLRRRYVELNLVEVSHGSAGKPTLP